MKKFLAIVSLALVMLMSGCGQKSSVSSSKNEDVKEPVTADASAANAGKDNFSDVDARASLLKQLETQLKSVYFDFDKFDVRPDMRNNVDANARILSASDVAPFTVRIEGNTDEWGTDEYNYALGLKRAIAVRDALVAKGIDESKTTLISYGESKPACQEKSKGCWSKNRRVDFKLIP
ncbi:MAG: OmpA family protein [Wolinella sp.]